MWTTLKPPFVQQLMFTLLPFFTGTLVSTRSDCDPLWNKTTRRGKFTPLTGVIVAATLVERVLAMTLLPTSIGSWVPFLGMHQRWFPPIVWNSPTSWTSNNRWSWFDDAIDLPIHDNNVKCHSFCVSSMAFSWPPWSWWNKTTTLTSIVEAATISVRTVRLDWLLLHFPIARERRNETTCN